jgi:hypothetical protein
VRTPADVVQSQLDAYILAIYEVRDERIQRVHFVRKT